MVVIGTYEFEEIERILKICDKLSPNLVLKGECFKQNIFKDQYGSEDVLWLAPKTTIRVHTHTNDKEWYVDWSRQYSELCPKGESHGLKNTSTTMWAKVISIKRND